MKHRIAIAGIAFALSLSACKKEEPAKPVEPAAPAVAAPASDPALEAAANPVKDFDPRVFAGEFGGTLPCADCEGIDTKIALAGDGTYAIEEIYRGKSQDASKGDGNWTAEDNGHRLRLDPNSKNDEDRLFEVVGQNEIRLMDKEGNAIQSAQNYSLKRAAAQ